MGYIYLVISYFYNVKKRILLLLETIINIPRLINKIH